MTESTKPLITFALIAYNQERFITEAVEGAFSQTYSPLQIILSDDCSSDGTFRILEAMAGDYDGAHEIVLNRNFRNLGIGDHINKIMDLSDGELIVVAGGDDVSLPERTDELYQYWKANDRKYFSIYSAGYAIDQFGNDLGEFRPYGNIKNTVEYLEKELVPSGATSAWHRRVFDDFGPIENCVVQEDAIIGFRALLLGSIGYVDKPLVKYRQQVGITSVIKTPDEWTAWEIILQHRQDMNTIGCKSKKIEKSLRIREAMYDYRLALLWTKKRRFIMVFRALMHGSPIRKTFRDYIFYGYPRIFNFISSANTIRKGIFHAIS